MEPPGSCRWMIGCAGQVAAWIDGRLVMLGVLGLIFLLMQTVALTAAQAERTFIIEQSQGLAVTAGAINTIAAETQPLFSGKPHPEYSAVMNDAKLE